MARKLLVVIAAPLVALGLAAVVYAASVAYPIGILLYVTLEGFEAVSSQQPFINAESFEASGDVWTMESTLTGTATLTTSTESFAVEVARLRPGETYGGDSVTFTANSEEWGTLGVAKYITEGIYTLVGYGYSADLPEGTMWWDFDAENWADNPVWGYKTVVQVPVVEAPSPACDVSVPVKPFLYPNGGICADEQPFVNGTSAQPVTAEGYNWMVSTELSGTVTITTSEVSVTAEVVHLAAGETYTSTALVATAPEWGGVTIVQYVEKDADNVEIFVIGGGGYQTTLTDWSKYALLWWDEAWVEDANWSETTILGVQYPWELYLPFIVSS